MENNTSKKFNRYELFASKITRVTGSNIAFNVACSIVVIWILTGPLFHFSDSWQLVINTGTTIVTFLMVFLIQKTQNKDSMAIQLKLNELIASSGKASNRLIFVEDLTEAELQILETYYGKLAEMAKQDHDIHTSHSIDEATERHKEYLDHVKTKRN